MILSGVREYGENDDVHLETICINDYTIDCKCKIDNEGKLRGRPVSSDNIPEECKYRIVLKATNEGGYNSTSVDFFDLLKRLERSDVINFISESGGSGKTTIGTLKLIHNHFINNSKDID